MTTPITRAQISTQIITMNTIMVSGFAVAGDAGAGAIYTSLGAGSGGPMAVQDAAGTWFQLIITGGVNVCWCGGSPTGINDTVMIDKAFSIATTYGVPIYFPGNTTNYVYSGSGIDAAYIDVYGDGILKSIINLPAGKYLIDSNQVWGSLQFRHLMVSGGAGAIRNRSSANSVQVTRLVEDCYFTGFTGAAISTNSGDDPFWKIKYNYFFGGNGFTTSMGIALAGYADGVVIEGNDFNAVQIGIKLGGGAGGNAHLLNNSFVPFFTGSGRANVWIVPATIAGQGAGFTDVGSRHGNESLSAGDYAVLYADQGSGTYFGDKMPVFTASSGYCCGHIFKDQSLAGAGSTPTRPLVYSTTPNLWGNEYRDIIISGSPPTYILQLRDPPTTEDIFTRTNVIGPITFGAISQAASTFKFTNCVGIGDYYDPQNVSQFADQDRELQLASTCDVSLYTNLLATSITGWTVSSATLTPGTDADGGADSALLNITSSGGYALTALTAQTGHVGLPIYIEFDVSPQGGSTLTGLSCFLQETTGFSVVQTFYFAIPTARRRVKLRWVPRTAGGTSNFNFGFGNNATLGTGTVNIGKVRIYQASNVGSGNVMKGPQFLEKALSTPATPTGGGYMWVDSTGNLKYVSPGGKTTTIATNT